MLNTPLLLLIGSFIFFPFSSQKLVVTIHFISSKFFEKYLETLQLRRAVFFTFLYY